MNYVDGVRSLMPTADITLPVLIPGATYRFIDYTVGPRDRPRDPQGHSPSSPARPSTWATSGRETEGVPAQ